MFYRRVSSGFLTLLLVTTSTVAKPVTIPANTRIYVEINEDVSGKKKRTHEGQIVRASVWRDVVIDGATVIAAGTPTLVRVDSLKGAKVAGIKGKMTLGAYETTAVDSTPLQLGGGYHKEGKGRVALVASLAGVLLLPLIFIKGKSANIPKDTVFDAYVDRVTTVDAHERGPVVNLGEIEGVGFRVEVLYDELEASKKPQNFAFSMRVPHGSSGAFDIERINGVNVEPIRLSATRVSSNGEDETWRGEVPIKKLSKQFKKGINTMDFGTEVDGRHVSTEVVLDVAL